MQSIGLSRWIACNLITGAPAACHKILSSLWHFSSASISFCCYLNNLFPSSWLSPTYNLAFVLYFCLLCYVWVMVSCNPGCPWNPYPPALSSQELITGRCPDIFLLLCFRIHWVSWDWKIIISSIREGYAVSFVFQKVCDIIVLWQAPEQ